MSTRLLLIFLLVWTGCSSDPATTPTNNDENNEADAESPNNATDMGEPDVDPDPCEPTDEVCDGEDNDCDGDVDEDFGVGEACSVGLGACAVDALTICNAAMNDVVCDAEALPATSDELCGDGIDNDCDGAIDEDFNLGDACTAGTGVCEVSGVLVCDTTTGTEVCDAVPLDPPEDPDEMTCDALDNDCDGEVDEGCDDDADGYCDAAFTVVSPDGDAVCVNGGGDCDDDDSVVYPGAPGLCDGKDNDCVDGIDDIKRRSSKTFPMPNVFAEQGGPNSPVQAIGTPTGFCYMVQAVDPQTDGAEGFIEPAADQNYYANRPMYDDNDHLADIAWGSGRCGALVVTETAAASRSAYAFWWTPNYSASQLNPVLTDDITHIVPSWDAALAFQNDTWVIAWSDTAGNLGSYTTLPAGFNSTTAPTAPMTVGNNGTFPELGPHPSGTGFLFASNFFNITVRQFQVGSNANAIDVLALSSSVNRSSIAMNEVGGATWMSLRHDGTVDAWELRRISTSLVYDLAGEVPYATTLEAQEYISRNPFTLGPLGELWFLDTVDEEFVSIADDGAGGLDIVERTDAAASGQLLAGRQISTDVTELLWLAEPGDATTDLVFEVAEYTCH